MLGSFAGALTALAAAVLLPLSVLSVWTREVVSDTDKYVETVTPLADDDVVKAAVVVVALVAAVLSAVLGRQTAPPGSDPDGVRSYG